MFFTHNAINKFGLDFCKIVSKGTEPYYSQYQDYLTYQRWLNDRVMLQGKPKTMIKVW